MDMQGADEERRLPTYFLANVVDDHLMGITHAAWKSGCRRRRN
jgi:glutamyl/glutaminyl-tRNA synthetase